MSKAAKQKKNTFQIMLLGISAFLIFLSSVGLMIARPVPVAASSTADCPISETGTKTTDEEQEKCDRPMDCRDDPDTPEVEGISANDCKITAYIQLFINTLSAIVGIVVVLVIIVAGIQYSASSGDPQAAAAAKKRISNAVLALALYAGMYGILQWLIPGGLF